MTQTTTGEKVTATSFSYEYDTWIYKLNDGSTAIGRPGDARIPCGMPFTEKSQWGANQILGRHP